MTSDYPEAWKDALAERSDGSHTDVGSFNHAVSFGPFRLFPSARLLERSGTPVNLGGRAFDILTILVARAPEVISKGEIIASVWPNVTVEDSTLKFHFTNLRKALNDGPGPCRYVTTIPGRGYCFTAPITRLASTESASPYDGGIIRDAGQLPRRLSRIIGRDDLISALAQRLLDHRLVTITGPAGVGKTTVAVAVAEALKQQFGGATRFIDLTLLREDCDLPSTIATSLGLSVQTENVIPALVAPLKPARTLIVFDNCEHVIDRVAVLVREISAAAPQVCVLCTSRESLRIAGEHTHRLAPLDTPPDATVMVDVALTFSAIQLFAERASASEIDFVLDDSNVRRVAQICRQLDGIPLAIELAAGCVDVYGVDGIAVLLSGPFGLQLHGARTADVRHQTLASALDWSFNLLTNTERSFLSRLSLLRGPFTLAAARSIAGEPSDSAATTFDVVASLVAKSLVSREFHATHAQYRLLDTTRAYAHDKLVASGEADAIARRHAEYFLNLLERAEAHSMAQPIPEGLAAEAVHIENIRGALGWSLSGSGDRVVGIALAAAAIPLFLELSLLIECRTWTQKALQVLPIADRGARHEMMLQAALGVALISTQGNSLEALHALNRAIAIAETLRDSSFQLRLYGVLYITRLRMGEFYQAFELARRAAAMIESLPSISGMASADWMLGLSCHFAGDGAAACHYLKRAIDTRLVGQNVNIRRFGVNYHLNALCGYARVLWLQGHCDMAIRVAREIVAEELRKDNIIGFTLGLTWTIPVYLWRGDWDFADKLIEQLLQLASAYSLGPTAAIAQGWKGSLLISRGTPEEGLPLVRSSLQSLSISNNHVLETVFLGCSAEALVAIGDHDGAITAIETAIERTTQHGETMYLSELFRIKGEVLMSRSPSVGEAFMRRALDVARSQAALSWELRAATSLARILRGQCRNNEALGFLAPAFQQFSAGFETADLRAAKALLEKLTEDLSIGVEPLCANASSLKIAHRGTE